jgi:glyoxylase-like metal-dependent hydrolase (beta-lactamase superfamily II)
MHVQTLTVGAFETNCYVVWGNQGEAVVIDPGAEPERVRELLRAHGLAVAFYALTHGHVDHVSALPDLQAVSPAPAGLHPQDLAWAFGASNEMPPFYRAPRQAFEAPLRFEDGQEWRKAGLSFRILSTPGHTAGSVCLLFAEQGILFSGDTLFSGSVGRTDLQGGDSRALTRSLQKLSSLPEETRVYPGHGPVTDIGTEKRTNYFMRA